MAEFEAYPGDPGYISTPEEYDQLADRRSKLAKFIIRHGVT